MSIFIYEDHIIQAQQIRAMIEDICAKENIQYDFIKVTSRCEDIVQKIHEATFIPIYFLDIEINAEQHKGFELAKRIRQYDEEGIIVFVTTHTEFAPISYEYMVSALTFIDKALPYEKRYALFRESLLHYKKRNEDHVPVDDFLIENNQATVRVPFATVQYIKTSAPHRLVLVTTSRRINFYGTLKEVLTLDDRLIRTHQSFIVNKDAIVAYDARKRILTLKNKEQVPVSRRLHRGVKKMIRREG